MSPRAVWPAVAIVVFLVSTFVAFTQAPRPDAYRPAEFPERDWWQYPIERNAFKRLSIITSNLNGLFALAGTNKVWAVGDGGMIVYSEDGGQTWEKQKVVIVGQGDQQGRQQQQQPPKGTLSNLSNLIPKAYAAEQKKGGQIGVPSVIGKGLKEATTILEKNGLRVGRVTTRRTTRGRPGMVIDQRPREGEQVERNVRVDLVVGAQGIAVPSVIGMAQDRATAILQKSGLAVGKITTRATGQAKAGIVIGQGLRAGARVQPNTTVDLMVEAQPVAPKVSEPKEGQPPGAPTPSEEATRPARDLVFTSHLSAVHFADAQRGWAVGRNGTILATANGGATWSPQPSGTTSGLWSVFFLPDGQRGWAVGQDGSILTTSNGGATWSAQPSGTTNLLRSVAFLPDGKRGWAVALGGTILSTANGGATWSAQKSGTTSGLWSVFFLPDGQRGWAVGDSGTILTTANGGATWSRQQSGTTNTLSSVTFLPGGQRGWAVGLGGAILTTANGGATWSRQIRYPLRSVTFLPGGQRGWAVGRNGTILSTEDGGKSWVPQLSGTSSDLVSIHFLADEQRGWIVGDDGIILSTPDGGKSWLRIRTDTESDLISVYFLADGQRGWIVGYDGIILSTQDGGKSWIRQPSGTKSRLHSVYFLANGQRGWAVGRFGTILSTEDGGKGWVPQPAGTKNDLTFVSFVSEKRWWAAGRDGTVLSTEDGGRSWVRRTSRKTRWLFSVHFMADGQRGWAVGMNGTILSTQDGGKSWVPQLSGTSSDLVSIHFLADEQRGWIVGDDGIILSTANGGTAWEDATSYGRSIAPWYYLSWLLVAALLVPAFKRPKPVEAEQKSVADMLVSDRPLEAGDPDPLDFNGVALGLSRFLRNENTQPPLTIAITGEWGTGKSSLMNLLKTDLSKYGFRPVWFNAWHHQKEEHLLASLLENIRAKTIPPWWRPEGLSFRLRLLGLRGYRNLPLALFLVLVFSAAAGYFAADYPNRLNVALQLVDNLVKVQRPTLAEGGSFLALLLTTLGALVTLWKGISAFRVNPASLMATMSGSFRVRDFKAQTGFRHQFAAEFRDVTRALSPRNMLVLIDDLDRCRPQNVLEVLEAVNFLVASGNCFVVIGMARDRVERCVGLGFRDVAEELVDDHELAQHHDGNPQEGTTADEGRRRRAEFAKQYMEKLINIEVPVPVPSQAQSRELIAPQALTPPKITPWVGIIRQLSELARTLAPAFLLFIALAGGFWYGITRFASAPARGPAVIESEDQKDSGQEGVPGAKIPEGIVERGKAGDELERGSRRGEFMPGEQAEPPRGLVYWPILFLLAAGLWSFSMRPAVMVKDSPEFVEALTIWHPLIFAKHNTPRAVKRFMNRVRYFAMRQRPPIQRDTVWAQLLSSIGERGNEQENESLGQNEETIPEKILVALSTIHHCQPEWLEDEGLFKDLASYLKEKEGAVPEELRKHFDEFRNWPPLEKYHEAFTKLSAGIRVS